MTDCGMSVTAEVYRVLERVLATPERDSAWSG